MSNDQNDEQSLLNRRIDSILDHRIFMLENRIEHLDIDLRKALSSLDEKIKNDMEKNEISIATRAADMAVHLAFSHLGVDVDDPKDLQSFRDDLRFGGVFRNATTKGFFSILAAVCGGIGLSLWLEFKNRIGVR